MTVPAATHDLPAYCAQIASAARGAAGLLGTARGSQKNQWLEYAAEALVCRQDAIQSANQLDISQAKELGLASSVIDRLSLDTERLAAAAASLKEVALLPDPVGRVLESRVRPNGLGVFKVGVPLGVIFFIYESRPNVTIDAAGLCVKSGNAVILRGGKEATHSNAILCEILRDCLDQVGLPKEAVQLVAIPDREVVGQLLNLSQYIDLVIPRGGEDLIRRVVKEARMPVLKHFRGNCHVYVDRAADLEMAEQIVVNAKCQRPSVCNAAESLLVHQDIAGVFLPKIAHALRQKGVRLRGCPKTCELVATAQPATDEDYAAEYLDLILSIKVVEGLEAAITHINRYGSQHTDAIVTGDLAAARRFTAAVDSSAVLVNASTRFNDGYELGLGAEIGISTDKFHARGPCGLQELTTYKYVIYGDGHVRGE
jgi:glutamate-5-semialdehyde dehydrogenase